jgi:ketosteroid isomerase-like protein
MWEDVSWETLRRLNDAWTKGDGKDLKNFFHKDMVAITPTDRNRRGRGDIKEPTTISY